MKNGIRTTASLFAAAIVLLSGCGSEREAPADLATKELNADLAPIRAALSQNPTDAGLLLGMAQVYEKHNQVDSALVAYQNSADADPKNWLAHFKMGRLQYSSGRTLAALDAYRNAVRVRPDFSEAYNNIGFIFKKSGQLDSAEAAYRSAINYDSTFVEAYNNLGQIYKQRQRWDESIVMFQWAIELDPQFAGAYLNLATACRKSDRPEEERQVLEAYLTQFGKSGPQSAAISERLMVLNDLATP